MYGNRIVAYGLVHTHAKAHVNPSIIKGDIRGVAESATPPVVGRPKKVGRNRVRVDRFFSKISKFAYDFNIYFGTTFNKIHAVLART